MAPESLAFFRSINCWPVVGITFEVFGLLPTDQEHPVKKAMAEAIATVKTKDFFMMLFVCVVFDELQSIPGSRAGTETQRARDVNCKSPPVPDQFQNFLS